MLKAKPKLKRGAGSLDRIVRPLALGTKTRWGKIEMVGFTGGERYYWMIDNHGCASMMPACMVEKRSNR